MIKVVLIYFITDYCIDRLDETIRFNMLQPEIRKFLGKKSLINKWAPLLDQLNIDSDIFDPKMTEILNRLFENQQRLNSGMEI